MWNKTRRWLILTVAGRDAMTAQMIQSNANMTRALHGTMETQTGPVVMLDTAAGKLGNEIQFGKKTNWRHLPLTNKDAVCITLQSLQKWSPWSIHQSSCEGNERIIIRRHRIITNYQHSSSVPTFSWYWLGFRRTLAANYLVRPLSDPAGVLMVAGGGCLYQSTHISHRNYLRLFLLYF